jgi:hypothetical protein
MAISNFPYLDDAIVAGVKGVPVQHETVTGVEVNFRDNDLSGAATATVTATFTWVVAATDAVSILDAARPGTVPASGTSEPA